MRRSIRLPSLSVRCPSRSLEGERGVAVVNVDDEVDGGFTVWLSRVRSMVSSDVFLLPLEGEVGVVVGRLVEVSVDESTSRAALVVLGTLLGCSLAYSRAELTSMFRAFSSPHSGGSILPTSIKLLIKS